jgi:AcrR family transcriptional regulator
VTPTTVETDQRRIRGLETRESVLTAAASLFARDGYSATGMAAIAAEADVRAASIYHAFGSKEGLLAAVVERTADDFFALLPEAGTQPDGLWVALAGVGELFAERPEFLRLLIMLAVERRQGDPTILSTALAVRVRGRRWITDAVRPHLGDVAVAVEARVTDRMSRLVLMLLDGAFIARQLDASAADVRSLFDLMVVAARAALPELLHEATTQGGPA